MEKVLVVLSGGQDSTTTLFWSIKKFGAENVETITFDYGQEHKIELESASKIAEIASVPNVIMPINTFNGIGGNSLTDSSMKGDHSHDSETKLPKSFVIEHTSLSMLQLKSFL